MNMSREKISRTFSVFPVRRRVSVYSYFWIYILVLEKVIQASVSLFTTGKDEYKITGEKIVGWGGIVVCQCTTGIYCPYSSLSGSRRQDSLFVFHISTAGQFRVLYILSCPRAFLTKCSSCWQLATGNLKLMFRSFPNVELEVVLLALEQSPVEASTQFEFCY